METVGRFGISCNAPYDMGSDSTFAVRRLYDVERRFRLGTSRVTYVIDSDGLIRAAFHNEVSMSSHVRNALKTLDDMQ